MVQRRKKSKRWQWTRSIMLWAFLISGIVHLCFVYLVPSVNVLPADLGYIEVDETWLATIPEEELAGGVTSEPVDEGTQPADTPEISESWNVPPQLDPIEPAPATERAIDDIWEHAFIGLEPDTSDTLDKPEPARTVMNRPNRSVLFEPKEPVARVYPKHMPPPDVVDRAAPEPEIQAESEVELQAEQRFEDVIASRISQRSSEYTDLERSPAAIPETRDSEQDIVPATAPVERQFSDQPVQLASVSMAVEQENQKSLPPVIVPDIPEAEPLPDEETIVVTDSGVPVPQQPAEADTEQVEEPQRPESPPQLIAFSQPTALPEAAEQERHVQTDIFPRQNAEIVSQSPTQRIFSSITSAVANRPRVKGIFSSVVSVPKKTLIQDDVQIKAFEPPIPLVTPQPQASSTPRSDALRALPVKETSTRSQGLPAVRQQPLLEIQRSFILGAKENVPTFPLEGPRFGILAQKETTLPEEELAPDTDVYPEDSFEQITEHEPDTPDFTIEGPVANRQVLFKPRQFPEVELDVEVTIRLKFWVLPDGTVGEVIPLQRGDVNLERAAIAYIKNWRFTPIPPDQLQMWGIMPITYMLR